MTSANVTGGIRKFGELGNAIDGDCVCAATEHNVDCKATTLASRWKKILYVMGFKPPTTTFTLDLYDEFLETLNEKPGPDMGIYAPQWFDWLVSQNLIVDWGRLDYTRFDLIEQAMIDYRGVVLTLDLTTAAWRNFPTKVWDINNDQPNPSLGHAVMLCEFTPTLWSVVTWGVIQAMTDRFWSACGNGAFVFVSPEDKERLSLVDYHALLAKTAALPKA